MGHPVKRFDARNQALLMPRSRLIGAIVQIDILPEIDPLLVLRHIRGENQEVKSLLANPQIVIDQGLCNDYQGLGNDLNNGQEHTAGRDRNISWNSLDQPEAEIDQCRTLP